MDKVLALILCIVIASCSHNEEPFDYEANCEYGPINFGDTLKILAIGNSFTENLTDGLPILLKQKNIKNVKISRLIAGGYGLKDVWYAIRNNSGMVYHYCGSDYAFHVSDSLMSDVVRNNDWDLIILQQSVKESADYNSYEPYLSNIINYAIQYLGSNVRIIWHSVWALPLTNDQVKDLTNQNSMSDAISVCTENVVKRHKSILCCVDSNKAVRMARGTDVNDEKDFCVDEKHIDCYKGKFLLAGTLYETVISGYFGAPSIGDYRLNDASRSFFKLTHEQEEVIISIIKQLVSGSNV